MSEEKVSSLTTEELATFCKQKGFVYKSSEIYGGVAGVYDYGHIGTLLKKNYEQVWRQYFSSLHENFFEIETGVIMHRDTFKASGHLENFFDPIVEVEGQDETFRADHLIEEQTGRRSEDLSVEEMQEIIISKKLLGEDIDYSKVSVNKLNMMFDVNMGPKRGTVAYLRPETAQSPYVNFKQQFELQRKKLPMGTLLIGRVFRNEISPRNMLLRTRELEQAELQIFFNSNTLNDKPEGFEEIEDLKLPVVLKDERDEGIKEKTLLDLIKYGIPEMYVYYLAKVYLFYRDVLEITSELRFLELTDDEKAFYNKNHFDIEYLMRSTGSWVEIGGVHYRTNHDLSGHQKVSKISMEVQDEARQEKTLPHVLELSFGVGRNIYTLIDRNIKDDDRGNKVFTVPNKLSPIFVSILPLMNKPELVAVARDIEKEIKEEEIVCVFDKSGSIGKRYARYDEIGTKYCITIDYETLEEGEDKNTVTIRDRDSTEQRRIPIKNIGEYIRKLRLSKIQF